MGMAAPAGASAAVAACVVEVVVALEYASLAIVATTGIPAANSFIASVMSAVTHCSLAILTMAGQSALTNSAAFGCVPHRPHLRSDMNCCWVGVILWGKGKDFWEAFCWRRLDFAKVGEY